MQNVKFVFTIDFGMWFVESNNVAERISGVNHTAMFIFDSEIISE